MAVSKTVRTLVPATAEILAGSSSQSRYPTSSRRGASRPRFAVRPCGLGVRSRDRLGSADRRGCYRNRNPTKLRKRSGSLIRSVVGTVADVHLVVCGTHGVHQRERAYHAAASSVSPQECISEMPGLGLETRSFLKTARCVKTTAGTTKAGSRMKGKVSIATVGWSKANC